MTGALPLAELPAPRQADVLAALSAVETADAPVAQRDFRALADPALRACLSRCLAEAGRVLLPVGGGYLTGYDDTVAARLAADGVGVLPPDDRAVLILILLHCVAIPRAAGRIAGNGWLDAEPVTKAELHKSQLADYKIDNAVRRLRDVGLIRYGAQRSILPGPQLARLTPAASARLWEELVLVAAPHGAMADVIRRRRAARDRPAASAVSSNSSSADAASTQETDRDTGT
jgi:hypothetical protein